MQGVAAFFLWCLLLSQLYFFAQRFALNEAQFPVVFAVFEPVQAVPTVAMPLPLSELDRRFQQGVMMLHAQQYEYALVAFHQVIKLSPKMPEAFVNMGYALLGLERYQEAVGFFDKATELRPYQGNAYWGLAVALDKQGDVQGAMGAMRTYIHLAPAGDPYVKKARSALWEWGDLLKRGPRSNEEQAWLDKRSQQWEERGTAAKDASEPDELNIKLK